MTIINKSIKLRNKKKNIKKYKKKMCTRTEISQPNNLIVPVQQN